jgi:hypothetical protein
MSVNDALDGVASLAKSVAKSSQDASQFAKNSAKEASDRMFKKSMLVILILEIFYLFMSLVSAEFSKSKLVARERLDIYDMNEVQSEESIPSSVEVQSYSSSSEDFTPQPLSDFHRKLWSLALSEANASGAMVDINGKPLLKHPNRKDLKEAYEREYGKVSSFVPKYTEYINALLDAHLVEREGTKIGILGAQA